VIATPNKEHTMTDPTMALMEYLRNVGIEPDESFLKEGLQHLTQTAIELEAAKQIGAGHYERTPERKTYRNGHRERVWETRVGEIPLRIPKMRDGTYFPSLLEPRRRSEKALLAVVQQAYVEGVSTRRVDDLLQALGLTGIDKPAQDAVQGAECRGSARSWTRWSDRSAIGHWKGCIPLSGWMPCTRRCGTTIGS
jgi:transposase-like protein